MAFQVPGSQSGFVDIRVKVISSYLIDLDDFCELDDLLLQALEVNPCVAHVYVHGLAEEFEKRQRFAV